MARLCNTLNQPDPVDLYERVVCAMHEFEQRVRYLGLPPDQLRSAHYALCASLDDVVLNTPWGSKSTWTTRSLVATFHQDTLRGERFFDLLAHMRQKPGTFLPVIELMYLCMSLGFQGRYRLSLGGPAELDHLRKETHALIIRQRPASKPDLSPHWKGVTAPHSLSIANVLVWIHAGAVLAIITGLFVWFSLTLNATSDDLLDRMLNVAPTRMPQFALRPLPPPLPISIPPPEAPAPSADHPDL